MVKKWRNIPKKSDNVPHMLQNKITGDFYISCASFDTREIEGVPFTRVAQNLDDYIHGRFNYIRSDSLTRDFPGASESNYKLISAVS